MKEINGTMVLETLEEIADPKHTALMVIDLQNDNASPKGLLAVRGRDISKIRRILPGVKIILEEARRLGLLIIYTRVTKSRDGSLESGPQYHMREKSAHSRGLAEYEMEGTWGNEVLDELEPRPNERQIIKYRPSAFIGTTLDLLLRVRGIKSVVVVGMNTEGCVAATLRDLQQYGYYQVVVSDCVTSTRKDLHEAALLIMSSRHDVVTLDELLGLWRSASAPKAQREDVAQKLPI